MKFASIEYQGNNAIAVVETRWNELQGGKALVLNTLPDWPSDIVSMQVLIERYDQISQYVENCVAQDNAAGQWISLSDLKLRAPIPEPVRNIICLGWNYAEHAKESSTAKDIQIAGLPEHPIVFTKSTLTVNAPFGDFIYDEKVSRRLDWEVELGVVIGKKVRGISENQALDAVFGYTVVNDISARDLQKRHQQFFLGKSVDGSCPMGPWIVTKSDVSDPQNLNLSCKVNGVVKQDANTAQQIFPVANVIATLSNVMTLLPGDIIATGTPSGVGFARNPPEYLAAGDIVECEVEQIGVIRNRIISI